MPSDFDEGSAIGNFRPDTIYSAEFKNGMGRFFNIVTEENGDTSVEYSPPYPSRNRIKLTVTFIRANGDIKEVTLKKFKEYRTRGVTRWEEQYVTPGEPMTFTHFSFEKLLQFLKTMTELDLANINERRIPLREDRSDEIDSQTAKTVKTLLRREGGQDIIVELLRNGSVTSHDIVNIGYRKQQLETFSRLLKEAEAIASYRSAKMLKSEQPEKAWQHFLASNEWIFGFGLDYRFLGILQDEARLGTSDLAGRGNPSGDFLLGAREFTVLVELKTPDTPLFKHSSNRAGSWQLSSELVSAVSQILEQKAQWQVRAQSGNLYDRDGHPISQKTADPKAILVIGGEKAFVSDSPKEREIKLRTFELFRRDSRNIEILTFDELYERATFIVKHADKEIDLEPNLASDDGDVPF